MSVATAYRPVTSVPLGIGYMLMAVSLFGCMDVLVKWLGGGYPTLQIMFCRSLFAMLPTLLMVLRDPAGFGALRTRQPLGHASRSLLGLGAMFGFFHAFSFMPLADVTAISFSAPVFIAGLSVLLLRETVGWHRWSAIVVGFVGMLVILRPNVGEAGAGMLQSGALVVVAATAFYALAMIQIRVLARTERTVTITFWFTLSLLLLTGIAMPWFWVTPRSWTDLLLLALVGLFGGSAQLLMTRAYSIAPAAVVAPFDYTHLLWAVLFGWYLWGDFPDLQTWIGCAIVIASGLYILYRETVRRVPVPPIVTE